MILIPVTKFNDIPYDVMVRAYPKGDLDEMKKQFRSKYGFDCKAAFETDQHYLMVIDPEYNVEVEK